jgi:hypothetical protein
VLETETTIEGIQRCFCMDIQRFKRDSTKVGTTHNWAGHYYTTSTLGQIEIKSKLCYSSQTRYR